MPPEPQPIRTIVACRRTGPTDFEPVFGAQERGGKTEHRWFFKLNVVARDVSTKSKEMFVRVANDSKFLDTAGRLPFDQAE